MVTMVVRDSSLTGQISLVEAHSGYVVGDSETVIWSIGITSPFDSSFDWLQTVQTWNGSKGIPSEPGEASGFSIFDQFLFDSTLANMLYLGGAYPGATGDGRNEKQFALEVCDSMFGLRYGEIICNMNYSAWTPWFKGIAWDLTAVVFDKRFRKLWMLTATDTD